MPDSDAPGKADQVAEEHAERPEAEAEGRDKFGVSAASAAEPQLWENLESGNLWRRFTTRYVVGLGIIGLTVVVSSYLVSKALSQQETDALVLGAAAHEALLSYQLTQAVAYLTDAQDPADEALARANVETAATELERTHLGLHPDADQEGLRARSDEIRHALAPVDLYLERMLASAQEILSEVGGGPEGATAAIDDLFDEAELFRFGIESIVSEQRYEADLHREAFKRIKIAIVALTLMLLIAEGVFLFRPAGNRLRRSLRELSLRHAEERKRHQEQLDYLAQFDPLTGAPNRALVRDRLDHAIARARRAGELVTLMFLDLDHFTAVNEQLGHSAGDAVLKAAAERLRESVRESDTIGRLGDDEFAIILEGGHRVETAGKMAQKVLDSLAVPYDQGGHELQVTASIGVAVYPLDGDQVDELFRAAGLAVSSAKEEGRNTYQFFTAKLREQATDRLHLTEGLGQALDGSDQLRLVYQPMIDLHTSKILGVEALLRWEHPELGSIPPSRFIPLAEETDLIIPLDKWVINRACTQAQAWRQAGLEHLKISVNISSREFHHGDLAETVTEVLDQVGLDARWLKLELTEGTLIEDTARAQRTLERLKQMGIRVSIDDFGTGYSSLSYLKRFPLDELKIDRSFVSEITESPDDAAIAAAIVGLGHNLGLHVIAEGVETAEQLDVLRSIGCDAAQGYLICRPVEPEVVAGFAYRLDEPAPV